MSNKFPLSQKYIDFINTTNVSAEFLEGTTASGKTTVGAGVKFMRMVSQSKRRYTPLPPRQLVKPKKPLFSRITVFSTCTVTQFTVATATRITSCRISSLRTKLSIFSVTAVGISGKWFSVRSLGAFILTKSTPPISSLSERCQPVMTICLQR